MLLATVTFSTLEPKVSCKLLSSASLELSPILGLRVRLTCFPVADQPGHWAVSV